MYPILIHMYVELLVWHIVEQDAIDDSADQFATQRLGELLAPVLTEQELLDKLLEECDAWDS